MSCTVVVLRHVYEYDLAQGAPSEDPRLAAEEAGLDQVGRSLPKRERLLPRCMGRVPVEPGFGGEGEAPAVEVEMEPAVGSAARGAAPAEPVQPEPPQPEQQVEAEPPSRAPFPWDLPLGAVPEAPTPPVAREKRPARS